MGENLKSCGKMAFNFAQNSFAIEKGKEKMQLEKPKFKIRCELGACKVLSAYTIRLARVGIRSRIHVCSECLQSLGELIKKEFKKADEPKKVKVPKSIETLKPKKSLVSGSTIRSAELDEFVKNSPVLNLPLTTIVPPKKASKTKAKKKN